MTYTFLLFILRKNTFLQLLVERPDEDYYNFVFHKSYYCVLY